MKTWIKRVVILVLVLATITLGSVGALLFSPVGLSVVLAVIPSWFPELSIEEAQGGLLNGFRLQGVALKLDGVDMKASSLSLNLNSDCLLNKAICINQVALEGLDLTLTETGQVSEPSEPLTTKINLPLPIDIVNVSVNGAKIDAYGTKVDWASFTTAAVMKGSKLTLKPTYWDGLRVSLPKTPELASDAAEDKSAATPNDAKTAKVEAATKTDNKEDAGLVLPDVFIPLDIDIEHFELTNTALHLPQSQVIERFVLKATAGGYEVHLNQVELVAEQGALDLSGDMLLFGQYALDFNADAKINMAPLKDHEVSLEAKGDLADLSFGVGLSGKVLASVKGAVNLLEPKIPFDLALKSEYLQWPLDAKADYTLKNSSINIKGNLDTYAITLATALEGKDIPALSMSTRVDGSLTEAKLTQLVINTLGGEIKGSASVNWADLAHWKTDLVFSDIQPQRFKKDIQGNLSGSIKNKGELTKDGGWDVSLPAFNIHGEVFSHKLSLEGDAKAWDLKGKGNIGFKTQGISVFHANNSLHLKGELDKTLAMNLDLNIKDLSSSLPDAAGVIKGTVDAKGSLKKPVLLAQIKGRNIKWKNEASIKEVSVRGSVTSDNQIQGSGIVALKTVKVGENVIDSISLRGSGTEKAQSLGLVVDGKLPDGKPVGANLALRSKPIGKNWQVQMYSSSLTTPVGRWKLEKDLTLDYNTAKKQATLGRFCWKQQKGKLCSEKPVVLAEKGKAELAIYDYSLAGLNQLSKDIPKINSLLNVRAKVAWLPKALPEINAHVNVSAGKLPTNFTQGVELGWSAINAKATLANAKLDAGLDIALTKNGDLSVTAKVDDISKEIRDINTRLKISHLDLSVLSPLLGEESQVQGFINADLGVSGDLRSPNVTGNIEASDLLMKSAALPVAINKGNVGIAFKQKDANLKGFIQTTEGNLHLTGFSKWREIDKWIASLNVKGENLAVNVPPMVSLKVSPNMTLKATPSAINVEGDINVPWGRILVESLPASAVTESGDLVILNNKLEPVVKEKASPLNLQATVSVNLGDDVQLDAFGLKTLLKGKLNVESNSSSPKVTGEINLEEGTYRSFGQDLLIKKGQILFNGSPTEPYLQVEAIRNPDAIEDDVEAGIIVKGSADKPEMTIFSKPAMPQANALSYLIRGSNLSGDSDNGNMTSMLIGLGLSQSGKLVGQIGEAFGVQDLSVDTAGVGDDEKVEVSGYILPGLQVKYGVGIFTGLPEFTLRYKLMKNFYIEAVSGLDNSLDFLYQFTRD